MNCKYCRANCTGAKQDREIALCLGYDPPKTNADRIRSMSDEELAEFICHNVSNGTVNCAFCAAEEFCRMGHIGWLDWMKQEVKVE